MFSLTGLWVPPRGLGALTGPVTAGVREVADLAGQLAGVPRREVWARPGRCHIAVRGLHGPDADRLARRVERTLERHPGVLWARVNAPAARVTVALTTPPPRQRDLVDLVAHAESHGISGAEEDIGERCLEPHHPCEGPRTRQSVSGLLADAVGLGLSTVARVAPWTPLPPEVAAVAGALQHHPWLRGLATRGFPDPQQAESILPVISALAHGVATGGGGIALDVVQRLAQWREAGAHREAWRQAEPELVPGPEHAGADALVVERPGPAPGDVADRHAERTVLLSTLAGAAATPFVGFRRGLAVALCGVAKAPAVGREGFATSFGRYLALRGTVVMDRGVLRRLGRVDTVVLDEQALRSDRFEPADLELLGGADATEVVTRLFALFDARRPGRVARDDDGWVLGPLDRLELSGRNGHRAADRLRRRGSVRVLGLATGRQLRAVVGLSALTVPGVDAVAAAARRVGVRLVLASNSAEPVVDFADAVVPTGNRLVASVRGLQADGAVVLLVSGNRRALGASDCGIGVHREGEPPAWGAHLLVGTDLEAARLVVDAVGAAGQVDRESAMLAAGGSGVGAVAAVQAPPERAAARGATAGNVAGAFAFGLGLWRARQLLDRPVHTPAAAAPWHLMPAPQVLERLVTSREGLTEQEAAERVGRGAGPGEPGRVGVPTAFVEELANPLTPVLAAGAALAAAVGSRVDAALVAAVSGTSALLGAAQRVRTERALAELFTRSAVGARVRRDGRERLVPAGDLVPGDVVSLRSGEVVPADCRLLDAEGLEVDESSLTGESLPVAKDPAPVVAAQPADRRSMLYEGTTVVAGGALAVVVATGLDTEVGRSLATARQAAPAVGAEARLATLTRSALPVAIGSAAAVTGFGLLRGRRLADTLSSAVGLAVASVPEGLPFVVNAAQLAASRRLAAHGALVRNPRTIEALGRADVLCFDKTGTLTEGDLALTAVSDGDRETPVDRLTAADRDILAAALRATPPARQSEPMAHHTDHAVVVGARRARVGVRHGMARWRRAASLPFEPSRAYHATAGTRTGDTALLSVKGAPENVLQRCGRRRVNGTERPLDDAARHALAATAEELAGAGRRVLAVAERTLDSDTKLADDTVTDLVFLGFLALSDPVRTSAAPAVAQLRGAGVKTVMLTGDHPATAEAIAAAVNDNPDCTVCTGVELDELDDEQLDALLPTVDVIARCSPHHKVRIVQAYQRLGRVVAMTGDGANDAPAIRLADVGIALGRRGSPAATAAADLVVGDDRLETVISALMEGRAMWTSVRAALSVLIGGNFGEIAFTVLTSALTGGAPLNARQFMLVNLLTDLAPALAIAIRRPSTQVGERLLSEGPDRSLGTALTNEVLLRATATATGATLAWAGARLTGRNRRSSTVALAALVGTQLSQTMLTGGLDRKVLVASLGSAALLAGVIQTPGVSHFFGCTPLGPVGWGIALGSVASATALSAALTPVARRLSVRGDAPAGPVRPADQESPPVG
ncbi:cation-translocating P-type ATPase [Wenjunlia vitaminophila]|uniref:cation-translocating P-type ATPase n=1 Tax=Wenjunlia vitaminophila TaxID=76728 RepID=UPI000361F4C5|nr:cation-translocating P-type ATPase [Wenjunlia vitaminophila]